MPIVYKVLVLIVYSQNEYFDPEYNCGYDDNDAITSMNKVKRP